MIKVFSISSDLSQVTGVQKVLMSIHNGLKNYYDTEIIGFIEFCEIEKNIGILEKDYIKFKNPFMLKNSIVIIHERKIASILVVMNKLLFLNIKLIYIHHSLFSTLKYLTILPENIVAISDRGIENLETYFSIPRKRITKIYNGIKDVYQPKHNDKIKNKIKILYLSRMDKNKKQVDIVKQLKDNLDQDIQILFAGIGPTYNEVKKLTENSNQFITLGYISDIPNLIEDCDYIMLYSEHEGLSIALIEGAMSNKPLIINDVGGNTEIGLPNKNSFIVSDWNNLISTLNNLKNVSQETYIKMSEESRKIYEENFTHKQMITKYKNLIDSLIK